MSFYSNSSLDEEVKSESPVESSPIYGGYVLSASHEHSKPFDNPASENRENSWAELPTDDPPAYTPSTAGIPSSIFSHPSGYCVMPNMEMRR
ncbi:cytokine receptor common subunit beta [Trichomycterus rosablanca]|uniref:cytokine receptor common subunit beta n=1 Tax=Trichomycterus rosablanca TaxID=2290929 RepID=UPI002F35A36E